MARKPKKITEISQAAQDEVLAKQIAMLELSGRTTQQISRTLSITPATVRKITGSEAYKHEVATLADDELGPALAKVKSNLAKLTGKAVQVLDKAMDRAISTGEGMREALEASKVVLKSVGLHEEQETQQDSTIIINMPEGIHPVTYELKENE